MKNAWRSRGWGGILIVLLTIMAYWPALRGGFIWDDDFYVTKNQALRSLEGLGKIWTQPGMEQQQYYPLAFTGLWVQYHLWDLQPFAYHLVNILLHALNALLLWGVLRRLEVPGSWWAAAIFALHPVQVESVAWITEFKNVSSALFSLLSLLVFLRFRPLSAGGTPVTRDWRFYAPALLLFLCALLCKTAVCCLPVVIAVLMWWKVDRVEKRDVLALIPWFVASLTLGLITMRVESRPPEVDTTGLGPSLVHRGLLAGRALWFYAGKVFWPHQFTFVYPRWNVDASAAWQYLFPLAALAVLIALWLLRRRIGKGPLAAVLCFAAMLSPVLGFLNIYFFRFSYVTDHFQYLACIGLIVLAVGAGAAIAQRVGQCGHDFGTPAAAVVLLVLGVSTWGQAHVYHNLETLWRDTLAKNPDAWIAHNNLGNVLRNQGKAQEAIWHYEQALRLKPDYVEAHNNLGFVLSLMGHAREAVWHYEQALRLKPEDVEVRNNLGNALLRLGKVQEALGQYEEAMRLKPDYAETHYNLGVALELAGNVPEAMEHYEQTLRLKPDHAEAHNNLGTALKNLDKMPEAIQHYEEALRIRPGYAEAHYNCGIVLARLGRVPEAVRHWEQALRLKPDYAEAHYNLGIALEQAGRATEAIGHYEQAVRIKPDYAKAQNRLTRLRTVH